MKPLLPLMDGLEATRIRSLAHDDAKRVPIVAVSAEAFEDDVEKPLEAGMNAHISKPVDIPALFTALRQLRDKRAGYERPLGSADLGFVLIHDMPEAKSCQQRASRKFLGNRIVSGGCRR